jgi:hypothetical protein
MRLLLLLARPLPPSKRLSLLICRYNFGFGGRVFCFCMETYDRAFLQVNNTTPKKNKKKKVYVLLMYLVAYTLDDTDSPTVIMQDVHVILSPVPLPQVFWVLC